MPSKDAARDAALRESYTVATRRLREAHPEEFNKLREEEAAKRDVAWKPTPSAKDKARDLLKATFAEHPDLLAEIRGAGAAQETGGSS